MEIKLKMSEEKAKIEMDDTDQDLENIEEFDDLEHNSACLACGDKLTSFGCLVCLSCLNDQCEQFVEKLNHDEEK